MTIQGRIPGRPGLWDVSLDGGMVQTHDLPRSFLHGRSLQVDHAGLLRPAGQRIAGVNFTDPDLTLDQLERADTLIRSGG